MCSSFTYINLFFLSHNFLNTQKSEKIKQHNQYHKMYSFALAYSDGWRNLFGDWKSKWYITNRKVYLCHSLICSCVLLKQRVGCMLLGTELHYQTKSKNNLKVVATKVHPSLNLGQQRDATLCKNAFKSISKLHSWRISSHLSTVCLPTLFVHNDII